MPKVFEKPSAARGVDDIVDFLFHRSPTIAQRFFASVWETYEWLSRVPEGGSKVEELLHTTYRGMRFSRVKRFKNYLIFYLPIPDGIIIYHVLDGRRDYLKTIFDVADDSLPPV